MNCMEPVRPYSSPTSANYCGTRDLLHDSNSEFANGKMDDYFSALFYDNSACSFGYDFWNNASSDDRILLGDPAEKMNYYNRRSLLASGTKERLYERNSDIDKLIAKFDANVEDIWKTASSNREEYCGVNAYPTLFSQNFFETPFICYESNFIWSFEQKETAFGKNAGEATAHENCCLSSFSHWNKWPSPIFPNSYGGLDAMFGAFNVTFSNLQNWSGAGHRRAAAHPIIGGSDSCSFRKIDEFSGGNFSKAIAPNPNPVYKVEYRVMDAQSNPEDEDLLTSTKTHFRPIRAEDQGGSQTGSYADGTTFAISNDLDKVSFKRSESGLLYLEADADTPKKYMEFKEKEICVNKGEGETSGSLADEFVPKFRLRQSNEKSIQTDELDEEQMVPLAYDTDGESISIKSDVDEFYFPGDDELAQNIINATEENSNEIQMSLNEENGNCMIGKLISLNKSSTDVCAEKDGNQNSIEASDEAKWSLIWQTHSACGSCRSNSEKLSLKDRYRFREELTQEGEQLLLDLSCLQRLYSDSTDWCEDDSSVDSDFNDEDHHIEETFGGNDIGCWGKETRWSTLIAKEEPKKCGFDMGCLWKEDQLFRDSPKTGKNIRNGREFERKRRNSSSQKAYNVNVEIGSRRPSSRYAYLTSVFGWGRGEQCTLFHGWRRPLSL